MSDLKVSSNKAAYTVPFIINGEEITNDHTFEVRSPAASEASHRCCSAGVQDAKNAVQAAAEALPAWRGTPPIERRNIFLKAAEIMEKRRSELVGYMLQETGDVESWCHFNLDVAIDFIKDVAGRCGTIEGAIPQTMDPNVTGLVLKEPYGVVLSIAPWYVWHSCNDCEVAANLIPGTLHISSAHDRSFSHSAPVTPWF
jgi:acyl-CoA reductase-like NAD-dependent aldehyde dehydrogenase